MVTRYRWCIAIVLLAMIAMPAMAVDLTLDARESFNNPAIWGIALMELTLAIVLPRLLHLMREAKRQG